MALAELQDNRASNGVKYFRQYNVAKDASPDKKELVRTKWLPKAERECVLLRLNVEDGTVVLLNGETLGTAPFSETVRVQSGELRLEAQLHGITAKRTLQVTAGETTAVAFEELKPSPAPVVASHVLDAPTRDETNATGPSTEKNVTLITVGGAALITGAMSAYFGILQNNNAVKARQIQATNGALRCGTSSETSSCQDLRQEIDDGHFHQDLATGFGITAGTLVLTDTLLFLLWPNSPKSTSAQASRPLILSSGTGGLVLGWKGGF